MATFDLSTFILKWETKQSWNFNSEEISAFLRFRLWNGTRETQGQAVGSGWRFEIKPESFTLQLAIPLCPASTPTETFWQDTSRMPPKKGISKQLSVKFCILLRRRCFLPNFVSALLAPHVGLFNFVFLWLNSFVSWELGKIFNRSSMSFFKSLSNFFIGKSGHMYLC